MEVELLQLLDDKDPDVQRSAVDALASLEAGHTVSPPPAWPLSKQRD